MNLKSLLQRLRRRYREPIIKFIFHLIARLPLSVGHKIGAFVGGGLWLSRSQSRVIAEKNIRLCFPEKNDAEVNNLVKASLREIGKSMFEIAPMWTWNESRFLESIHKVNGEKFIQQATQENKGVIILTPHLGAWEVAGLYLSIHYPMTALYKPPRMSGLENIVVRGRTRFGSQLAPTDVRGVRALFQALKKGEMLGILPDQDPGQGGGEFAPFFNIQTNTMTLVARLAEKTDTMVLVCFAERLASGQGFVLHISPVNPEISSKNTSTSLNAMNAEVEKLIRQCPQQYQWSYKRFKTRPEGQASFY